MSKFRKNLKGWSSIAAIGIGACLCMAAGPAQAAEEDTQQWTSFILQKDLSKRWRAYFEVQPRFAQDISELERVLVRPAIGYRIRPNFSVWQGYLWNPQVFPSFRDEHRMFQQFLYEDNLGKTSVTNRLRFEQRWIGDTGGGPSHRIRNMIRLAHPISADKRWALVVSDEVFWNLNSVENGPVSGFDQNRAFVGVSRQVNFELRVETGYLLNSINSPSGSPNRNLHVWVVSFNWKL